MPGDKHLTALLEGRFPQAKIDHFSVRHNVTKRLVSY